jgi:hypothetical protein
MTRSPVVAVGIAAVMACSSSRGNAQIASGVTLTPGTHVRVTLATENERARGSVVSYDDDSLRIDRDARAHAYAFPNIARLEVRGGRDRRRGILRGALILGGIGVVFGGIDAAQGNLAGDEYAATIVTNALIGGALGLLWSPRGWREIPLQRRVTVPP